MLERSWIYYLIEVIKADGVIHPEELRWLSTFASNMTSISPKELDEIIKARLNITYTQPELQEIIQYIKRGDVSQNIILLSYCVDVMRADDIEAEAEQRLIETLIGELFGERHVKLFMNWIDSDLKTKALWAEVMKVIASLEA